MKNYSKLRILIECAIMVAIATVIATVLPKLNAPQGGSITLGSMIPIVFISIRHGSKWGALTAIAYSGIQMLTGFYAPPTQTLVNFILVILLDYVIAFGALGIANSFRTFFAKIFKNSIVTVAIATVIVTGIRFACHFLSGILIWSSYAPEGTSAAVYSLVYNGGYMLPEIIISTIGICLIFANKRLFAIKD